MPPSCSRAGDLARCNFYLPVKSISRLKRDPCPWPKIARGTNGLPKSECRAREALTSRLGGRLGRANASLPPDLPRRIRSVDCGRPCVASSPGSWLEFERTDASLEERMATWIYFSTVPTFGRNSSAPRLCHRDPPIGNTGLSLPARWY